MLVHVRLRCSNVFIMCDCGVQCKERTGTPTSDCMIGCLQKLSVGGVM